MYLIWQDDVCYYCYPNWWVPGSPEYIGAKNLGWLGKNENAKKPEKFSFYSSEENISNTAHFGSSSEQFSFKWSDFSSDWPEM